LDKLLARSVKKGEMTAADAESSKKTTLGQITFSTDQSALASCDLVVEAIIEDIKIKVPFYEKLGKLVKPEAIFASNTSSLAITKMAQASGRADRFGIQRQMQICFKNSRMVLIAPCFLYFIFQKLSTIRCLRMTLSLSP
jgi:3-hydroxyacyl-CoA dehydrogenase